MNKGIRKQSVVLGLTVLGVGVGAVSAAERGDRMVASSSGAAAREGGTAVLGSLREQYRRPSAIPYPDDNPYSESKARLGQILFFDPRLSGSNWISCATCHNPGFAWGDGLPRGIGHGMNTLGRRTPTTLNLGWAPLLFWDGREESLEAQALGPMSAAAEMNQPIAELEKELGQIAGYKPLFQAAFGETTITGVRVAKAIATFERTLVSHEAPFDRWVNGDEDAISASARRGLALFNGRAMCSKCHSGWRFTDDGFHDVGVAGTDRGRGKLLPGLDSMQFAFKTPTLRNIAARAPYMHDGSEATLEQVVELYNRGGRIRRPSLATEVHPLKLTAGEKADLVQFMLALTSVDAPIDVPTLPR
jgi:cytochrome c peroxidase